MEKKSSKFSASSGEYKEVNRDQESMMKDSDGDNQRRSFTRRKRPDPELKFDYKDLALLSRFVTESGKIVPARVNRLSAKQQRQLTTEIKKARHLALLPCAPNHTEIPEYRPRSSHYGERGGEYRDRSERSDRSERA